MSAYGRRIQGGRRFRPTGMRYIHRKSQRSTARQLQTTATGRNLRRRWLSFCAFVLLFFGCRTAVAQQQGSATVLGAVLDSTGAVVQGAEVTLIPSGGTLSPTLKSGTNGEFTFAGIPAGSYCVTVKAVGFDLFRSEEFTLTANQVYPLRRISLTVAAVSTSVVVRPTEEIAAEQIKAEEKQRLFGVFPNFYVSYDPDPAPLTPKQKFSLAAHDTFDWTTFAGVTVEAGLSQATNAHKGYGQGAAGYGKRWGAALADQVSSDLLSHYVFSSLFHQDPRYFYQGTGTRKSRLYHALSSGFVGRSDRGKVMPNYAYFLGALAAGGISNAYYPAKDRGAGLVFSNAALSIAFRAGQSVMQEFFFKRFTKNVPDPNSSTKSQATAPGREVSSTP